MFVCFLKLVLFPLQYISVPSNSHAQRFFFFFFAADLVTQRRRLQSHDMFLLPLQSLPWQQCLQLPRATGQTQKFKTKGKNSPSSLNKSILPQWFFATHKKKTKTPSWHIKINKILEKDETCGGEITYARMRGRMRAASPKSISSHVSGYT